MEDDNGLNRALEMGRQQITQHRVGEESIQTGEWPEVYVGMKLEGGGFLQTTVSDGGWTAKEI